MQEELTQEQKDKFPEYVKKWAEIGNSVVTDDFYTEEIISRMKYCVVEMYKEANKKIDPKNILISSSPTMSPFLAASMAVGKKGKPKKEVRSKKENMGSVEVFLNGFKNPHEIIKKSADYTGLRYWLSTDCGFIGFVDYILSEVDYDESKIKGKEHIIKIMREISHLGFDALIGDGFCVVSKKPEHIDLDTTGDYPIAKTGEIRWGDGTVVKF